MIAGSATAAATAAYAARHAGHTGKGHFRIVNGLSLSSIGIGTYLGNPDAATDALVAEAVRTMIGGGVNVIDTAINYRHQRGERSAGTGIAAALASGTATREELVVCTKGGYLPDPGGAQWFRTTYVGRDGIAESDLAEGCNCLHPAYLADQIERSRRNLGLEKIDVYYLHNPEHHATALGTDGFRTRLEIAFGALENAVAQGVIGHYGLATWNGLRVPPGTPGHIDLAAAKAAARQAAGGREDHFGFVQMPCNLGSPEALIRKTQPIDGSLVPAVAAAQRLGLAVAFSRPVAAGRLPALKPALAKALGDGFATDVQRALQFARGVPETATALVGAKQPAHVAAALEVAAKPALPADLYRRLLPA
ncbi:MAG: aldo/keto reductase [Alphaproteobacteria bacterium]